MKYGKVFLSVLAVGLALMYAGCGGKDAKTAKTAEGGTPFSAVGYGDPWGGEWNDFSIL